MLTEPYSEPIRGQGTRQRDSSEAEAGREKERRGAGSQVSRSGPVGLLDMNSVYRDGMGPPLSPAQARETGRSKAAPREAGAAHGGVWGEKGRRCQRHGGYDGPCLLLG